MSALLSWPTTLWQFIQSTYLELQHVTWPNRRQTIRLTSIVLGVCLVLGAFLAGLDYVLSQGLKFLIK